MRTLLAFLLRLVLYVPLVLAASMCHALGMLFERLGDGLTDAARGMHQITRAPFLRRYDQMIEQAAEEDRARLLKRIRENLE